MIISELETKLAEIKAEYGDIECPSFLIEDAPRDRESSGYMMMDLSV